MAHKLDEAQFDARRQADNDIDLSDIAAMTYAQLDTYIDNNVTDLPSARAYLRKISRIVLAILKKYGD